MTTTPSSRTYVARTGQTSTQGACWQCRQGRLKKKRRPVEVVFGTTMFHGSAALTSLVALQARRQYSHPMQRSRSITIPQW